jgi:hypothetical protein
MSMLLPQIITTGFSESSGAGTLHYHVFVF